MDLDTFIVIVFCLIDDRLDGGRIRQRGPKPKLSDSEVLTLEVVGESLGIDTDQGLSTLIFDGTTARGSRLCIQSIALPSSARRQTFGA